MGVRKDSNELNNTSSKIDVIKRLRKQTGLSVLRCKEALQLTNFDLEKAFSLLKKNNILNSVQCGSNDDLFEVFGFAVSDNSKAFSVVKVCCKTDFAAKTDVFKNFVKKLSLFVLNNGVINCNELFEFLNTKANEFLTIEHRLLEGQLGEAVVIKDVFSFKTLNGFFGFYIHHNFSIIKLISVVCISSCNELIANNLALQVAYMKSEFLTQCKNNFFLHSSNVNLILKQFYIFNNLKTVEQFLEENRIMLFDFFLFVTIK